MSGDLYRSQHSALGGEDASSAGLYGQQTQQQPSRIKSFFRQNQNSAARRTLIPLAYAIISALYFYGLLCRDVGSGVHVIRDSVDGNATYASAPVWGAPGELMKLEPRSLADVTIANAEVAWKRQLDQRGYARRRAEKQRKMREDDIRLRLQSMNVTTTDGAEKHADVDEEAEAEQPRVLKLTDSGGLSNETNATKYLRGNGNTSVKRIRRRKMGDVKGDLGFLPVFVMISMCTLFRVMLSVLIGQSASLDPLADSDGEEDEAAENEMATRRAGRGSIPSFMSNFSGGREAARLRRRARAVRAHRQFQRFVDRLNAEREANGERQISADTLRHLVHSRDFNGNDYDRLSSFVEENGPAIGSIFSAIGATEAEINRCPSRTLAANDDLLRPRPGTAGHVRQTCPVCLEAYQVGETVRTIPCFHAFHRGCIDPWLAQRAECPVCKHSAIG